MNTLGTFASATVVGLISGPKGMNANLASLGTPDNLVAPLVDTSQIYQQNVAADLAERSTTVKYPSVYVYCEKYANKLTEKFRSFSGSVQMAIEVRHSQDRLDGLQDSLELYVDSVTQVLDAERGDWGNGLYYAGGYDVSLGAVKHGGRNFLQTAKISFQIEVSRT
ncbi:MAG TPA: hypothetical protein VKV17_20705 [Bryobacteraceae bacterium]|nr:hypothetical protein [Bryobacteraceae bacterium]